MKNLIRVIGLSVLALGFTSPVSAATVVVQDCGWDGNDYDAVRTTCLTQSAAEKIISVFVKLFQQIDPVVAERALTPDFRVFSDSSNYVTEPSLNPNYTAGAVTFSDRDIFVQGQLALQAAANGTTPEFKVLAVYAGCNSIAFRWRLQTLAPPTSGIDVVEIIPGGYKAQTDYSEFNNIGLLSNFGCTVSGGACDA